MEIVLDNVTPAEASTRLEEAREAYRMAQVSQAVSESDVVRGRAAKDAIPILTAKLTDAELGFQAGSR